MAERRGRRRAGARSLRATCTPPPGACSAPTATPCGVDPGESKKTAGPRGTRRRRSTAASGAASGVLDPARELLEGRLLAVHQDADAIDLAAHPGHHHDEGRGQQVAERDLPGGRL